MRMDPVGVLTPRPRLQAEPAAPNPAALPLDEYRPLFGTETDTRPQAAPPPPPGPRERKALDKEKEQQDRLAAEQIYARMRAERALVQARLAALVQDLQTEIQRIFQEVLIRRRKVHDAILANWHKVLIG